MLFRSADERAGVARPAVEYQADERARVARLSWRVSGTSASLCQADSTPKSLTWTDNRKNLEVQRRCDLLKVTKVFTGRVQTWPGVPQKTPLPKVHGEHSLSEWILASLVISQGQLCTPGSEGLPWTLSGCTAQGHREGLN